MAECDSLPRLRAVCARPSAAPAPARCRPCPPLRRAPPEAAALAAASGDALGHDAPPLGPELLDEALEQQILAGGRARG